LGPRPPAGELSRAVGALKYSRHWRRVLRDRKEAVGECTSGMDTHRGGEAGGWKKSLRLLVVCTKVRGRNVGTKGKQVLTEN